jgi:hypothetical protein
MESNTDLSTYDRLVNSLLYRFIDNYETEAVFVEEVDLNRK